MAEQVQLHEWSDRQFSLFPNDFSYKSHGTLINDLGSKELSNETESFTIYDRVIPEPSTPCETRVMLSHAGVNVDGPYKLDWIDHQVIDAVASISLYQECCTASMIYCVMTGKKKSTTLSEAQRALVIRSMDKLSKSTITISLPETVIETKGGPKRPIQLEFSGQMIAFEKLTAKTQKECEALYRILVVPALFRYANSIGRVSEFPLDMMNTPPAKTESILLVQEYLLHRLDAFNRQEAAPEPILWRDIRDIGQWKASNKNSKKVQDARIRKLVREIMDHWVKYAFILAYSMDSSATGGIRVTPNFSFHTHNSRDIPALQ